MWRIACLRLVIVLLALAVGTGPSPGGAAVAQSSGLPDMRWVSPNWGFTVRWYSNEWFIADQSTVEENEFLALRDSLGNSIVFQTTTVFGGDAEACLDWLLTNTESYPDTTEFRLALDTYGAPYVWRSPTQAYAVVSLRAAQDTDTERELVGYLECQTLVPDEAVLQRLYSGPPEMFEDWFADIVKTIEAVFLPATGWIADDPADPAFVWAGIAPLAGEERIDAAFVLDASGQPQLLVGLEAESALTRMVTFENVSEEPLAVAPGGVDLTLISAIDAAADRSSPLTALRWEDGFLGDVAGARTLAPGERATALLDFAPADFSGISCDSLPLLLLGYTTPDGSSVEFAEAELPAELNDCLPFLGEAAAGRPVLAPPSITQQQTASAVQRISLLTAMEGRLDDLGRIPLGRLVLDPDATFADLPDGAMALYVERGAVEVAMDNVTMQIPAEEQLTADSGADLTVRNTSGGDAVLLVLALEPTASWDTWDADDPFRDRTGFTFTPLFPELNLLDRQAGRRFTVEVVRLAPGATFSPAPVDGSQPRQVELLVESGSVTVHGGDANGVSQPVLAGTPARVPVGESVTAGADGPASLLVVYAE